MLTRIQYARKCEVVHLESTRGEVTRIRYPVTRITYLKTFCVKRINLVYILVVVVVVDGLLIVSLREHVIVPPLVFARASKKGPCLIQLYLATKSTKVFVLGLTNCSFGTQIWEIWIRDGSSSWPVLSGGLLRALVDQIWS